MAGKLQTVIFTAQVRIHNEEALRQMAAEHAIRAGLSSSEWTSMRSGSSDDVVMLLDPGCIAGTGFEIVHSRCEALIPQASETDTTSQP